MPRRPESFNEVSRLYDRARPEYPQNLVDDIVALTGLGKGDRVLEIGCGTGQMTVPLAMCGAALTAIEPGADLAAIARRKFSANPRIEVIVGRFEDYELPIEPFDLVIAATSFHWVDPNVRVAKSAACLRPRGHLAIVHTHWGVGTELDDFSMLSQACYQRFDPENDPNFVPRTITDLARESPDLVGSSQFDVVEHRFYEQVRRYTTESYLDLLRTFSNVQGMDPGSREGLLTCIGNLTDHRFGGTLVRSDTRELWLAVRS